MSYEVSVSAPSDELRPSSRDHANWAKPVARLAAPVAPYQAINLNVEGRRVVGPLQGFGQLWQKTYRVRLDGCCVTPAKLIAEWKAEFPGLWPKGNHFYAPLTGITPGEVALLSLALPGGVPMSTGMLVVYADDVSFTLMTPQGHMESGWITFSADYDDHGCTIGQVQSIARANDPLYELGFMLFAHRVQERFWRQTLRALAAHYGLTATVEMQKTCVDGGWQWSQMRNVWQNAALRTIVYLTLAPVRWFRRRMCIGDR
jgi:hypothetical protein